MEDDHCRDRFRHRQVARVATGRNTLRPLCVGGQVASRGEKAQPRTAMKARVGGTRRDPESLGRSAECHFTRGPHVSSCRISNSPVLFEEAFFSSRKTYNTIIFLLR